MENDDIVKLVTMISTLGHHVVGITEETYIEAPRNKPEPTGRYVLTIHPAQEKN